MHFSVTFSKIYCISYNRTSSSLQWEYCPHFTGENRACCIYPALQNSEKSKLSGFLAHCLLMVVTRLLVGKPATEMNTA